MRVGRMENQWSRNCVAVGLSQGFIEPLEATALLFVQRTAAALVEALEQGDLGPAAQQRFNDSMRTRFENTRDYIVAHYKTNSRTDTDYWRANAEGLDKVSDSLKAIYQTWFEGRDLAAEIRRQNIERYYPIGSWYSLLAGRGNFPDVGPMTGPDTVAPLDDFMRRCALNFRDHRSVLEELAPPVKAAA